MAQAPQAFNYQGVARDLSGNPILNQSIGLQIAILKGSATGTEVYKENHNTTTTDLGLFSLQIGTGTSVNGVFEDIDWGSDRHFMQVELDENGGSNFQIIGTSELLSVPYAIYAENGSKWNENSLGLNTLRQVYLNTEGRSGLFENWPLVMKVTEGTNASTGALRDRIMAFLNRNNEPSWHFMLWENNFSITESGVEDGRLFIEKGGNVGLSTINPKSKLHLSQGDIFIEDINSGVIMKSPNGQCWRMSVSNSGQSEFTAITCPN